VQALRRFLLRLRRRADEPLQRRWKSHAEPAPAFCHRGCRRDRRHRGGGMKRDEMTPQFVEFIPEELEPGVVYISTAYATASHLCACGCGNKVVTPLGRAEWELIFDGERVSLFPSI